MFKTIRYGLILSGAINIIASIVFSKFYTNEYLFKIDPAVTSVFGMLSIAIWGVAMIWVAPRVELIPKMLLIFSLEKTLYFIHWVLWMSHNSNELPTIFDEDFLSGMFLSLYGPNDLLFIVFFIWAYKKLSR